MKISEALKIVNSGDAAARPYEVSLLVGFTSLHLQTFLTAHLQARLPNRLVSVATGLFGNLAGELEKAAESGAASVVAVLEWGDIDPRLGHRAAAAWDAQTLTDIRSATPAAFARLRRAIEKFQGIASVVLCPPTLPFPPLFQSAGWQASCLELFLLSLLSEFSLAAAELGVRVANLSRLAVDSPVDRRHDFKSELHSGFPYTLSHADAVAATLSRLLIPPEPKKGLITDLDDTLWSGTVGEVGPEGVHWDLDGRSHAHALYQSLLSSLADSGVLLGVASKNDPRMVQQAFGREDLLLTKDRIFPMEIHWQSKAQSVARILRAWNIAAGAAVFVDDNPSELAEVAEANPGIECVLFPNKDPVSVPLTLTRLRDLFGTRAETSEEDTLRLNSLRQGAHFREVISEAAPEGFLRDLKAHICVECDAGVGDRRALELVNKTNQFNLNGIRYSESDWAEELSRPGTTLMTMSYEDRFGKLGKIATILAHRDDGGLRLKVWVMSCRAFGRRIEYVCLRECFERHGGHVSLDFVPTPRNGPFQEFLRGVLGQSAEGPVILTREQFDKACPPLHHAVTAAEGSTTIHG
jgi:FkbH-like protein